MFRFLDIKKVRQHFSGCETLSESEVLEVLNMVFKEMVKVVTQHGWEKNTCYPLYEQDAKESFKKEKLMLVAFLGNEGRTEGIGIFGPEAEMGSLPDILEIITQQSIDLASFKKIAVPT